MSQSTNKSSGDISMNEKKYQLASNWALHFFQSLELKLNDINKKDPIRENEGS